MIRWIPCLLAVAGLLAPSVMAETTEETFIVEVDADEVVIRMQVTLTAEDAQAMREEIDEDYGNGDGRVTRDEVSRFNVAGTKRIDQDAPECFEAFEFAWIDETTPKRLSMISGRAEVTEGSTTSIMPIRVTADFTLLYPTASASNHLVQVEFDELDSFGEGMACVFGMQSDDFWFGWGDSFDTASDLDEPETLLIQPKLGYRIEERSVQPERVKPLWDDGALRADTQSEQFVFMDEVVTFTLSSEGSSPAIPGTVMDVGAFVGFGVMGASLVALAAAAATEYGRFQLWKLLFLIPGFTRLEKDEVLEHTKRDELYRFIKQNPGQSFSDLRRELSLSNGTLVHHLRILEAQEYLKGVRDGFRTRFYVRGPKIVMDSYLTRTQIQLVEAISANPGLTQKELSHVLGLPRESISYHAKQLAAKGRLEVKQDGKWRRYWPNVSTMTSAPGQS